MDHEGVRHLAAKRRRRSRAVQDLPDAAQELERIIIVHRHAVIRVRLRRFQEEEGGKRPPRRSDIKRAANKSSPESIHRERRAWFHRRIRRFRALRRGGVLLRDSDAHARMQYDAVAAMRARKLLAVVGVIRDGAHARRRSGVPAVDTNLEELLKEPSESDYQPSEEEIQAMMRELS